MSLTKKEIKYLKSIIIISNLSSALIVIAFVYVNNLVLVEDTFVKVYSFILAGLSMTFAYVWYMGLINND